MPGTKIGTHPAVGVRGGLSPPQTKACSATQPGLQGDAAEKAVLFFFRFFIEILMSGHTPYLLNLFIKDLMKN
jgi:hypothetical protein